MYFHFSELCLLTRFSADTSANYANVLALIFNTANIVWRIIN